MQKFTWECGEGRGDELSGGFVHANKVVLSPPPCADSLNIVESSVLLFLSSDVTPNEVRVSLSIGNPAAMNR